MDGWMDGLTDATRTILLAQLISWAKKVFRRSSVIFQLGQYQSYAGNIMFSTLVCSQ
jgi:hypothetical protein